MSKTTTDPIADMLSRIRNAIAANHTSVQLPHSNIKESVAKLLKANGFIDDVKVNKASVGKILEIDINDPEQNAKITEIVRLSKPGRRHYASVSDIPKVKQGRGIVIVSTSQGLMTGDQAISKKVGGELICKVY
jgi:small subunit ribosomal protein S8